VTLGSSWGTARSPCGLASVARTTHLSTQPRLEASGLALRGQKSVASGPALPLQTACSSRPPGLASLHDGRGTATHCNCGPGPAPPAAHFTARAGQPRGHASWQLASIITRDSSAALGPALPLPSPVVATFSWRASPQPAEAGSLSAEGVVLVWIQLLFLNDNLGEATILQDAIEVSPRCCAMVGNILAYIHHECLCLTYQGHPFDEADLEAIPWYPEELPWPATPADVIQRVGVNRKTLAHALLLTPVVHVCHEVEQLMGVALGR